MKKTTTKTTEKETTKKLPKKAVKVTTEKLVKKAGEKKRILFAAFEAVPFSKTGGLGDVAGSLPGKIKNDEFDVRVILPKLGSIPKEYADRMKYVTDFTVNLGWRNVYCGLFTLRKNGVTYYFLDNEFYFYRNNPYGEFDDGERIAFFSKAVLEAIRYFSPKFLPDIIHCNDWHTALVPVFLREFYMGVSGFENIKIVFTIHNLKFQGQYDKFVLGDILGLSDRPSGGQLIHDDAVNYLQGAVIYADAVTTVSPTYAEEICAPEFGEGLEGLFQSRKYKLSGIINGINQDDINPEKDKNIPATYTKDHREGKALCKAALQKELGFDVNPEIPLYVTVSRLTMQKGANLLNDLLGEFTKREMQFAVLGTGDRAFEDSFKSMASFAPKKFGCRIMFSEKLSRLFYAGADFFLMPSLFEPCGLAQMMAMRYGTLPIVRETGGLKDTVKGYWDYGADANGFSFKDFDDNGLKTAVDASLQLWYDDKKTWNKLQENAMTADFGWEKSAEKYRELYRSLF